MIDRRQFAVLAALGLLSARATAASPPTSSVRDDLDVPLHDMSGWPPDWTGSEQIVMLAYPGMTALDLVGPQYMFGSLWGATVKIAAKSREPIVSDTKLTILPDIVFSEAVEAPDVLFVPGGISGTLNAMEDSETIEFIASQGASAKYVTSVCTGALILGQAGLLDGYRAATHWLAMPAMDAFGATAVDERVVQDRNRITGGGVTAGIDFGLSVIEELRGTEYAQTVQLLAEYAPEPPLTAGHMSSAPQDVSDRLTHMFAGFESHVRAVAALRR
ncbi:DJ-1/PfpI family protein [Litoreibacter roseus]|uniref:Thiazole biosynthesis protein ThiJ n=1 Tax=Litoreibacter roseus TaxID=2601869 RepID=A0A6N6JFF0_9RHOB|nr:DJ-1/PfpI family protein [Litoreibacter roseus]GFE64864.1 thiazole biosynthesis protein ThiJ [Litoreibacter roseus]